MRCSVCPTRSTRRRNKPLKSLVLLVAAGCLLLASGTMAQMRPGAKVEKTYGLGLPRDMDKLIPPDSDYPVYPLKPSKP